MQKNNLPISVNICTFNEELDIADCLDRIIANKPEEIIVIDGGSADATVPIAQAKGAKVISAKKKGFPPSGKKVLMHLPNLISLLLMQMIIWKVIFCKYFMMK